MKLDAKKLINLVISKTIIFIAATAFVLLFKYIFGENNSYIGISVFIATLMYLERDLTQNFIRHTLTFIGINVVMGIMTSLIVLNPWTGIPLNLILVFGIGLYFCPDLKRPVYVPFILQYIFLICFPVQISKLPVRLIALVVGAIIIMIPQLLVNRKKIEKASIKIFLGISNLIPKRLELMINGQPTQNLDKQIYNMFISLKSIILDGRDRNFYISREGQGSITLLTALENITLESSKLKDIPLEFLEFFNSYFSNFSKLLNRELSAKDFRDISTKLIEKHNELLSKDVHSLKIMRSLYTINTAVKGLDEKFEHTIKTSIEDLPQNFKNITRFLKSSKNSIGFSYAVRVSIGMTIACFITQIFKLENGIWIMFTIFSLVNPLYEASKYKSKDRIISTLLGALATIILLTIFKTSSERTIIILLAGYFLCYTTTYKYMIFLATISIVAMTTGTGNALDFTMQRILFVLVGFVITIILNTFVLRTDLETQNEKLKTKYAALIFIMIDEIYKMTEDRILKYNRINNLFLSTALIEKTIQDNFNVALVPHKEEIDLNNRLLNNTVYNLYLELERNIDNLEYVEFLRSELQKLSNSYSLENFANTEIKIKNTKSTSQKLVFANIYDIKYRLFNFDNTDEIEKIVV
ncbi:MAG: FUSC family protein [Sarcina sp.]